MECNAYDGPARDEGNINHHRGVYDSLRGTVIRLQLMVMLVRI